MSPALNSLLDRVEELPNLWLGLRITKRILIFDPESDVKLPELKVSTPQRLFENLQELVITSVIRPRVAVRNRTRIRQADLYALLKRTSVCSSPEELSQVLRECPTTNSMVLLEDNVEADENGHCSSCHQPLTTPRAQEVVQEEPEFEAIDEEDNEVQIIQEILPVNHLRTPNARAIDLLFQDHQKFMFFFERVAELFIEQRKDNPRDVRDFMQYLLGPDSRLRVSWRFLTVIVRTALSTRTGTAIIDELLSAIRCNQLTREMNPNSQNLLRALLACADQDARQNFEGEPAEDVIQAAMTGEWTVERIRRLAQIRQQLTTNQVGTTANVIAEWGRWRLNRNDRTVTDSLLYFVLRFSSGEGDQTRLGNLFRHQQAAEELVRYQIVGDFMKTLSPLSLGFDLQSGIRRAIPFQERLLNGDAMGHGVYQFYPQLLELQPNWAPFIARLAYHAADVFEAKKIRLLRELSTNLIATGQFLLPGIDNHPYLPSFMAEAFRWYMCHCRTLNCVGNCGNPTAASICVNCGVALSPGYHVPRAGVRRATLQGRLQNITVNNHRLNL